jgi:hypothetical protein
MQDVWLLEAIGSQNDIVVGIFEFPNDAKAYCERLQGGPVDWEFHMRINQWQSTTPIKGGHYWHYLLTETRVQ